MNIVPSVYVTDWTWEKRSWRERLFSWPWNPLLRYTIVKNPKVYYMDDQIVCSYETFDKIKRGEISLPPTPEDAKAQWEAKNAL